MKIDMEKAENQDPKPRLEEGEFIESFSIPLKNLSTDCRNLDMEGFAIDAKLGAFAEGIEVSSMWRC
jgi:ADP-ribose pyrophosphatase